MFDEDSRYALIGSVGACIVFVITFVACWLYAISHFGLFLGIGLGWIPSGFIAVFAALFVRFLWPLLLIVVALITIIVFVPQLINGNSKQMSSAGRGLTELYSRYAINGGEVYDNKTNLTWARCSVGQKWVEGNGCVGDAGDFTFDEARSQASGSWRVPTREELETLFRTLEVKYKGADPRPVTIDEAAFPNMDHFWYWSSTPANDPLAWYVSFGSLDGYHGYSGRGLRTETKAVRLVRSGH